MCGKLVIAVVCDIDLTSKISDDRRAFAASLG